MNQLVAEHEGSRMWASWSRARGPARWKPRPRAREAEGGELRRALQENRGGKPRTSLRKEAASRGQRAPLGGSPGSKRRGRGGSEKLSKKDAKAPAVKDRPNQALAEPAGRGYEGSAMAVSALERRGRRAKRPRGSLEKLSVRAQRRPRRKAAQPVSTEPAGRGARGPARWETRPRNEEAEESSEETSRKDA